MALTRHARERFALRFADYDLDTELAAARAVSPTRVKKLRFDVSQYRHGGFSYFLARGSGALFVVSADGAVVTVLRGESHDARRQARTARRYDFKRIP